MSKATQTAWLIAPLLGMTAFWTLHVVFLTGQVFGQFYSVTGAGGGSGLSSINRLYQRVTVRSPMEVSVRGASVERDDVTGASGSNPSQRSTGRVLFADSIALTSRDSYCRGANPVLTVTGTQVSWYADAAKKNRLAQGNTYNAPSLDQTTTFYLTQTLNGVETLPVAITIEIVEAFLRQIVVTPASCEKNDGVISVTATGGTERNPLYYSLNKGPAQRSPVFRNLAPGTYLLMDSAAAGCWGTIDVTVTAPPTPTITVAPVDPQCGRVDGSLGVSASGGAGSFSYSLNGLDYGPNNQFSQLPGGVYRVWVQDKEGCSVSQSVTLKKSVPLQWNDLRVQATSCGLANGRIDVSSTTGNGILRFTLDSTAGNTFGIFDKLPAKTYSILVMDEMGCRETRQVTVGSSAGPSIRNITIDSPTCGNQDGSLTVSSESQNLPLSYRLNGMAYQRDSTFRELSAGTYEVTVKDAQDCLVQQSVQLGEPCLETIYLPDSFTPNQDGLNDYWAIFFPFSSLKVDDLTIYNRWGEIIFYVPARVLQSGDSLWDGPPKAGLQAGVYTYRMSVVFPDGKKHVYQGTLFLIL